MGSAVGVAVVGGCVGANAHDPNVLVSSLRNAPPVTAETPAMITSYEPMP